MNRLRVGLHCHWEKKSPSFELHLQTWEDCTNLVYVVWRTICSEYGNTGYGVSSLGIFCLKIYIPKRNYWILRIGVVGRCQQCQNFTFNVNFFFHWIISIYEHIFCNCHFLISSILNHFITTKIMANYWQLPTTPILKIQ